MVGSSANIHHYFSLALFHKRVERNFHLNLSFFFRIKNILPKDNFIQDRVIIFYFLLDFWANKRDGCSIVLPKKILIAFVKYFIGGRIFGVIEFDHFELGCKVLLYDFGVMQGVFIDFLNCRG